MTADQPILSPAEEAYVRAAISPTPASTRTRATPTQLRALSSSVLAARGNFGLLAGLPLDGLSFDGRRDLYQAFGFSRLINPSQYVARYRRGGIAHRIVEVYPRATWGSGLDIIEDEDPNVLTPFEAACRDLFERLIPVIIRADKLANIGQYSVILIGAPGELNTPLPRMRSIDDIAYFNSYGQTRARITKINLDPSNPLFGSPEEYTITIGTSDVFSTSAFLVMSGMTGQTEVTVHASRIIHLAEGALEDNIYGQPRLEAVWNLLDSLDKVTHGGGEQAFRGGSPPAFINLNPDIPITPDQEAAMDEELDSMVHSVQAYARLTGANVTVVPLRVPDIKNNAAAIMEQIGGTLTIPQRILAGSEMGHLASTQDENNFDDAISNRNQEYAAPLVRQVVERLVGVGALPHPKADKYEVVWPTKQELNEKDRATVTGSIA